MKNTEISEIVLGTFIPVPDPLGPLDPFRRGPYQPLVPDQIGPHPNLPYGPFGPDPFRRDPYQPLVPDPFRPGPDPFRRDPYQPLVPDPFRPDPLRFGPNGEHIDFF